MKLSRRSFLVGLGLSLVGCGQRPNSALNFYNWSNFIAPGTLKDFEKRTGLRVNYEEFSSADVMYAKLKIGVTGYDLVVAPGYMVRRMVRQNLLEPISPAIDRGKLLPHLTHPPYDPELQYSVPYLWGTTGVAYNRDRVQGTPDSWDLLWDARYRRHITVLDEKRDAISMALFKLGLPPNSTDAQELAAAKQALLEQRPLVRRYTSDFTDDLIREETWVALGWSGDVAQAKASNEKIEYFIPKEGSFLFVDSLCIPKGGPHPQAARAFIDYFLEPQVCAAITNATGYANPVTAAKALAEPHLIDSALGYPSEELMSKLVYQRDLGEHERAWDRIWEEVKR